MRSHPRPGPALKGFLLLVSGIAVAVPAYVVTHPPSPPAAARVRAAVPPPRVVPATVVPDVEPVRLVDLSPDEARAYNADVPFVKGPNPAARPFRLRDAAEEAARATDCLAAAVLYEAGDDPAGQRAVAQVVLNRLRHPAFPKTVCGVVFEGQERRTGCQFTFTCDGALTRWSPPAAMWTRARQVAEAALAGGVYRKVGYATHYHTDWVVPYWQSSLDKIARVGDHLFFRWTGWWGTPAAFTRAVTAREPVIGKIAAFSDAHRTGSAAAEAQTALAEGLGAALVAGATSPAPMAAPSPAAGEPDTFLVAMPTNVAPEAYPQLALAACGARPRCKYLGWTDTKWLPRAAPPDAPQMAAMAFSYLRDRAFGLERTLWNCTLFPYTRPGGCMRRQPSPPATVLSADLSASSASDSAPAGLDGVRRTGRSPAVRPAREADLP